MADPATHAPSRRLPVDRVLAALQRLPLWVLATAVIVVLVVVTGYAASRPLSWRPPIEITPTRTPTPTPEPTPAPPAAAPDQPDLLAAIASIETQYRTSIGLAIAPIASPGHVTMQPWVGGSLTTALAWRTIDVPVAMAVASDSNQPKDLDYLLKTAITQDSPAGDEALWQFLGTPEDAVDKTTAILTAAGDTTTILPAASATNGSRVFTDVWWGQGDAAQVMGGLFCMSPSWPVVYHLTEGGPLNGFGLASLPNSLVRTGSGDVASLYSGTSIRQVGILTLDNGARVGVSLSAAADDGTGNTASQAMTAVAALLPSLEGYTATTC
ncbi:MAG: hypothetical protein FWF36_07805 [Propionibacteriaceae bacterium]|nr:hypothetical protein [Propionibacteriaceae bacterium]